MNARYLEQLSYGAWATKLDEDVITAFLGRLYVFADALRGYERRDNGMLFQCLDELIEQRARGEERPVRLESPAMGKYEE